MALFNLAGRNALTFALADTAQATILSAGVNEERARLECQVRLFAEPATPVARFLTTLRLDARPLPYQACLREVAA